MSSDALKLHNKINAIMLLEDGSIFYGRGAGYQGVVLGELCFNTGMTGYQETLSDPSYTGQIINFTFPHIGNVGYNESDKESFSSSANGLITREDITIDSSYRSQGNLNDWLSANEITAICGVDTRAITRHIRKNGAQNAIIEYAKNFDEINIEELKAKLKKQPSLKGLEIAEKVSCKQAYDWNEGCWQNEIGYKTNDNAKFNVVVIDYGTKINILRCLVEVGCNLKVVPAKTSAQDILELKPDGVFLSNGPGDPEQTSKYALPIIKELLDKKIPIFGICLGHQLLSLALGCKTEKLHQGHRGSNHPVKNLSTNLVEITSQNHGFVVTKESLSSNVEISHVSLFDDTIEGINCKDAKAFSVQHHPEASPGPSDSFYLFERFVKLMEENA